MIKAEFQKIPGTQQIVSVRLIGHAGQNDAGYDLICAAASALFIAVCNGLEEYVGIIPDIRLQSGDSELKMKTEDDINNIQVQTLLHTLLIAMRGMQQEHPEYISVTEEKK